MSKNFAMSLDAWELTAAVFELVVVAFVDVELKLVFESLCCMVKLLCCDDIKVVLVSREDAYEDVVGVDGVDRDVWWSLLAAVAFCCDEEEKIDGMFIDEVDGDLVSVRLIEWGPAAATDAVDEADVRCCVFFFIFPFF